MSGEQNSTSQVSIQPNPGSEAALDAGCRCPVLDNNHGVTAPYPPSGWWINEDCPIHGGGS